MDRIINKLKDILAYAATKDGEFSAVDVPFSIRELVEIKEGIAQIKAKDERIAELTAKVKNYKTQNQHKRKKILLRIAIANKE